jgi:putative phosphoribosyl transferase
MSTGARPYRDRRDAGRQLAHHLAHFNGRPGLLVTALPRGGVAVASEVAQALRAPLDVVVVRKLGFPGHEEYAMGAIASGGVRVMNPLAGMAVTQEQVERVALRERAELERRERAYRGEQPACEVTGRTVIVVDDGIATGATMRAAAQAIRRQHPLHLCVAVPVGARESCEALREWADEVVCPSMPEPFKAVGLWYLDFPQSSDDEVHALLQQARGNQPLAHCGP